MNDSRWYLAATGVADLLPSAVDSSTPTGMQGVTVTHSSGHSSALSTQQKAGFCLYLDGVRWAVYFQSMVYLLKVMLSNFKIKLCRFTHEFHHLRVIPSKF